jgi:hypothetical protein
MASVGASAMLASKVRFNIVVFPWGARRRERIYAPARSSSAAPDPSFWMRQI